MSYLVRAEGLGKYDNWIHTFPKGISDMCHPRFKLGWLCIILVVIFRTVVVIFIGGKLKQCFSHCILQPSSGILCLSGHRNDSAWEIIFKVWLLIKQGVQEIWRFYSNTDVIVFPAYQSENNLKKFPREVSWGEFKI